MIFDTFIIPTFAIPALIFDDWEGLSAKDIVAIRAFQQRLPKPGQLFVRDGDAFYSTRHELRREVDGMGGMCFEVDYVVLKPKPKPSTQYNGWANYQTWNVALWLQNDEDLYLHARNATSYKALVTYLKYVCQMPATPDSVAWDDPALDTERLEELIVELRGDA
jgi:hypothetical protein